MTYLLDTSILINFLRGNKETNKLVMRFAERGVFAVSVITYGELLYGAYRSKTYKREREVIMNLVNDLHIAILPLTTDIVDYFAAAKFTLEKAGNKLDDFDLLIGATSVASGSTLITDNTRHFRKFPGIVLQQ